METNPASTERLPENDAFANLTDFHDEIRPAVEEYQFLAKGQKYWDISKNMYIRIISIRDTKNHA